MIISTTWTVKHKKIIQALNLKTNFNIDLSISTLTIKINTSITSTIKNISSLIPKQSKLNTQNKNIVPYFFLKLLASNKLIKLHTAPKPQKAEIIVN